MDFQEANNLQEDDRSLQLIQTLLSYMTVEGVDFQKCEMMENVCSTNSIAKNACQSGDTEIQVLRTKCAQEKEKFAHVFMLNLTSFVKKNSFMRIMFWDDTSFRVGVYLRKNAIFKAEETSPYSGLTKQTNVSGSPFLTRQISPDIMHERLNFHIHLDESRLTKLNTNGLAFEDLSQHEQNVLVHLRQSITLEDDVYLIPLINTQTNPRQYRITQRGEINYGCPWHVETSKEAKLLPTPSTDTHSGISWDALERMAL